MASTTATVAANVENKNSTPLGRNMAWVKKYLSPESVRAKFFLYALTNPQIFFGSSIRVCDSREDLDSVYDGLERIFERKIVSSTTVRVFKGTNKLMEKQSAQSMQLVCLLMTNVFKSLETKAKEAPAGHKHVMGFLPIVTVNEPSAKHPLLARIKIEVYGYLVQDDNQTTVSADESASSKAIQKVVVDATMNTARQSQISPSKALTKFGSDVSSMWGKVVCSNVDAANAADI